MNAFALAVDTLFEDPNIGDDAIVQGSPPRTIRVVRKMPDEVERFASRQILTGTLVLEVRAQDMAGIAVGTRILVAGAMRVVRGTPEYGDPDRLIARVDTVPEPS